VKVSLLAVLEILCARLAIVALALMVVITFIDVVGRVVFDSPLGFSYELIGILLAVSFYSGLYHVHKKSKHIRIELFDGLFKGRLGLLVTWFGYLLEVAFFIAVVVMIFQQMQETRMFGEVFMFLGFAKWYALLAMFVLAAIALVSLTVTLPESARPSLENEDNRSVAERG
jgi:TRAP-type transport system small permease protein